MQIIHEICHAVACDGHGKVWQARMERAAKKADDLGRHRFAELLREEIVSCQEGREQAYQSIQELWQVKRSLADQYGMLYSEVGSSLRKRSKLGDGRGNNLELTHRSSKEQQE